MKLLFVFCATVVLANIAHGYKIFDYFTNKDKPLATSPVCGNFTCPYGTVVCKIVTKPTSGPVGSLVKVYCLGADNKVLDSSFSASEYSSAPSGSFQRPSSIEFSAASNKEANQGSEGYVDNDNSNDGTNYDEDEDY